VGADVGEPAGPALILDGVVEQRGNRLVLATAVLQHERRDPQQMGDVGHARALADLVGVRGGRVGHRLLEPWAEHGGKGRTARVSACA
jgi:hypothetical protein